MRDEIVSAIMAQIGRKGGSAGTGAAKRRGTPAYYRALSRKAAEARKRAANARKAGA